MRPKSPNITALRRPNRSLITGASTVDDPGGGGGRLTKQHRAA